MFKRVLAWVLVLCMIIPSVAAAEISDESEEALLISDEFAAAYPYGAFSLKSVAIETPEQSGRVVTKVVRQGGTSGQITVTLKAIDITAKIGQDYNLVIPGFIFGKKVKADTDQTLIESGGTGVDSSSDVYSLLSDTYSQEADTNSTSSSASKGGLRAAREQATGVESDRGKFTNLYKENSQLAGLATLAALDYYNNAEGTEFTLTFDAGERVKEFYIDIVNDSIPEADEQLLLVITKVSGEAAIGTQRETTVNIIDDEPYEKPEISFSADSYYAGKDFAEITLVRTAGLNYYAGGVIYTIDGSALGDEDYTPLNQSFLFIPGQAEMKLSIPVISSRASADKHFYIRIVPNESCTVRGSDSAKIRMRKPMLKQASDLALSDSEESSPLLSEESITLGVANKFYNSGSADYTKYSGTKASYPSSTSICEVSIQHDSIDGGVTLNRTLYKSMLDSIKADITMHIDKRDNHFDVWIHSYIRSTVLKEVQYKIGGATCKVPVPTFTKYTELMYGHSWKDDVKKSLTVMDRSTSGIGDDPFTLAFEIKNGNRDYGSMRIHSVTLNFRRFNFVPVSFYDTIYTFDFSNGTYETKQAIPGTIEITDDSGRKINGFYTSQDKYTLHVSTKDVLPGYYLKELRFYESSDAQKSPKYKSYPMDRTGGTLIVDNDFLVNYAGYSEKAGSAQNFLIQPVFARDPATLTVSINDKDINKGEVLGVDLDSANLKKTFSKNNTDEIELHVGDNVILTGVGKAGNAVSGFYVTTGDGSTTGKKTEAVGEHLAGVITVSLAKTTEVTPIFGERTLVIKPDPSNNPGLTGTFTINGEVTFNTEGRLDGVKSGQVVDIAVIPPEGYTTQWINRSGDTNGNGVLDDDETRDENGNFYLQYDYNGDGELDADYKTALYGDLFRYRVNQPQTLFYYSFVPLAELPRYSGTVTGYVKTKEYNIFLDKFTQAVDRNGKSYDKLIPVAGAEVVMGGTYDPNSGSQISYGSTTDSNGRFTLDVSGVLKHSPYMLSIRQNDTAFYVDSINPSLSSNFIMPPFASMRPLGISATADGKKGTVSGSVITLNKDTKVSFVLETASLESNVKVAQVDFRVYSSDGTLKHNSIEPVSMQKAKWTVKLTDVFDQNDILMVQLIDQNGSKTIEYNTGYEFRPPLPATTILPSFIAPKDVSIPLFGSVTGALELGLANLENTVQSGDTYIIQMGYEHAFDDYEKVLKDTISEAENDDEEGKEARDKVKEINEAGPDNKKSDTNVKTKSTITNSLSVNVSLKMVIKYDNSPSRKASGGSCYYFDQLLLMVTLDDTLSFSTTVLLPIGLSIVTTLSVGGSVTGFIDIRPITIVGEIEPKKVYMDEYGNFDYTDSNMFKSTGYSFHVEGGVILQPKIHLKIEGNYSVGSVTVDGGAEFFLIFTTDHNDRGTVTLNAGISVKVLGIEVYSKEFVNWTTGLFGDSNLMDESLTSEAPAFTPVSREYLNNRGEWLGPEEPLTEVGPGATDFTERPLMTGIYPDPDIQLARIDEDSILMVFIDDDPDRSDYNRSALYYSISHDNGATYSAPVILSDDGTLDSHPRLIDLGDKILCLYSSLDEEIESETTIERVLEVNGLEMKFFDKDSGSFTTETLDVTQYTGKPGRDSSGALLGDYTSDENGTAVYDPVTGRLLVIYTKTDYSSDEDRPFSLSNLFNPEKSYSAVAYRIYDTALGEFLTYDKIGYPEGVTTDEDKSHWDELWYGQKFLDSEIKDDSLPGGGIKDPLVFDLTAVLKEQTAYIAYTVDMDNDLSTTLDRDIYLTTYDFAYNTFTKAVKASDIYGDDSARADGRPQLILYNNSVLLFYASDNAVCYIDADAVLSKTLPPEPYYALKADSQSQPADSYRVLTGDDGKLYLLWTENTLRYVDGVQVGSQEALEEGNAFNELQIYASSYFEDFNNNPVYLNDNDTEYIEYTDDTADADDTDDADDTPLEESPATRIRYGVWSAKTQLTAGPGSYSDISAAVMKDGRILLAAKKSDLVLFETEDGSLLRDNPNTAQLMAISLYPAVRAVMQEGSITFDSSYPVAGEPTQIYASFHNQGLMPLINPVMEFFAVRGGVNTLIGTTEVANPVYGGEIGLASLEWTVPEDVEGLKIAARLKCSDSDDSVLAESEAAFPWGVALTYNALHLTHVAKDLYQAHFEVRHEGNSTLSGAELVISQVDSESVLQELKRVPLEDQAAGTLISVSESFTLSNAALEKLYGVLGGRASIRLSIEKDGVNLLQHTGKVTKNISGTYGELFSTASGFTLSQSNLAMSPGLRVPIRASGYPTDAFRLVYSSSNPSVAAVNENGEITALNAGTALITAYAVPDIEVRSLSVDGYRTQGDILDELSLEDCPSAYLQVTVYSNNYAPVPDTTAPSTTGDTTVKVTTDSSGKASASVSEQQTDTAIKNALSQSSGARYVSFTIEAPKDAKTVETTISSSSISQITENQLGLTLSTPVASVSFDAASLGGISASASEAVTFTASQVDTSSLPDSVRQVLGSRPVYEFTVKSGDSTISEFDGSVTVSMPYTLAAGEDPNAVIVSYINADGKLETVTNGKYDEKTGTVIFSTNHFSKYAIDYKKLTFDDVSASAWYADAVTFLAARGITTGTSETQFSPDSALTRGQFVTLLLRAYGIKAEENTADNYSDAGNTYYTGYLAAAKRLGISNGVGDNRFAPEKPITRQEMFTLIYNTLKTIGQLPQITELSEEGSGKKLSDFSDADQIASWAADAMELLVKAGIVNGSAGKLTPLNTSTRAQMAQVLYNLLGK